MFSLRGVVASVLAALFFSIAVDPAIRALQRRGLSRLIATAVCVIVIVAVAVSATAFALPALQREAIRLRIAAIPRPDDRPVRVQDLQRDRCARRGVGQ